MAITPQSLTIRTYAVGFGDCFLLTFSYEKGDKRHVLIDFGSTALPREAPKDRLATIARDIKKVTDGKLDAIVATHRHADHINGFATNKRKDAPGDVIRSLKPRLVVQPWTEDPAAAKNATGPRSNRRASNNLRSISALESMHDVAFAAAKTARTNRSSLDYEVADQLSFIGQDNIKNLSAVKNLMTMPGARRKYVAFGDDSGLESVIPGVKVHVLGPPTLDQHASIRKERARDPSEFWQFWNRQGIASAQTVDANGDPLFPSDVLQHVPPSLRWFRRRLVRAHSESLLSLVRILDTAMNNTSVILLFEVGQQRILFPGDAQIENWEYALSRPATQKLISGTTLYKVGHHGSLNATPKKKLWSHFANKGGARRLAALLSTREDKHGHSDKGTEVPRRTLLKELEANTKLLNTLDFKPDESSRDITIAFTWSRPRSAGPRKKIKERSK